MKDTDIPSLNQDVEDQEDNSDHILVYETDVVYVRNQSNGINSVISENDVGTNLYNAVTNNYLEKEEENEK